ncbi:BTAD domain-containing putative transcriptional regulator [Streptomyces sp. SYP-A7185]|uniref:BTAD domain-containing putative transcriptional regulator n=1 Tax=Streptomyces sp. SYP-A7185 TaxID=3040076 RepID=UPI0038F5F355
MRGDGLRFGLLGAPAVYDADGEPQPVQSAKGRALLAALLLEPGRVVSVDALKDALWGGTPPASARASLQNHVTRLRRLLDDPERLRAVPPGYRLRVADGELDVRVFEQLVAQARAAHAERDWDGCARAASGALGLWRGTPLGGLPADATGHALVPRLEEARLLALEFRYDAELASGAGGGGFVPELAELVAEYPLRENFHRQLMLALHRTGRQAEALAVHRELRHRLIEELGVEPGASIREAHREVLQEPAGGGAGGAAVGAAVGSAGEGVSVLSAPGGAPVVSASGGGPVVSAPGGAPMVSASGGGPVVSASGGGPVVSAPGGAPVVSAPRDTPAVSAPGGGPSGSASESVPAGSSAEGDAAVSGPGADASNLALEPPVSTGSGSPVPLGLGSETSSRLVSQAPSGPDSQAPSGPDSQAPSGPDSRTASGSGSQPSAGSGSQSSAGSGSQPSSGPGSQPAHTPSPAMPSPAGSGPAGAGATFLTRAATRPAQLPPSPPHFTGREEVVRSLAQLLAGQSSSSGVDPLATAALGTAALGTAALGTAALGTAALGTAALGTAALGTAALTDATPATAEPTPAPPSAPSATSPTITPTSIRTPTPAPLPAPTPTTPPVAVLSGMAGVGKSALALHVAHRLREHFPDGQLYVNLRGATPGMTPLTPAQALAALLRDLGVESAHSPEHPDAAAALLRSLLAPTRTLLVLDDAATAAQVRPLLPAGPGCAVIVTSRSPLTALDGAGRFPLEPLSEGDSVALLRAVSGRAGLDAGHPLVELAGRLPLALRIIAARLAARRALTPDALAELLTVSGGRLHHLEHDDLSVRRSLAVALDALRTSERESDRDAAAALAAIGALDLPAYGVQLVARLLGVEEWRAGAALDRLVDVALLDETAYGRYAPHDLVRDFARETAHQDEAGAADVVESALRWYAESALQTLFAIMPGGLDRDDRLGDLPDQLLPLPTPEGRQDTRSCDAHPHDDRPVPAVLPMTTEDAFAWGDTELANVIALADRHGRDSALLPVLVRCFFSYLKRRGRLAEAGLLNRLAVTAARHWEDTAAEAQALTDLAGLNYVSGRSGTALDLIDEALDLWRRLDRMSCVHRGVINRGLLLEALGRYEESAEALRQSLDLATAMDDPLSEAFALSTLGNVYEHTDARAAISYYERSLAIGETLGHDGLRQEVHCDMGKAYLALGEPDVALRHFEESLRIHGVAEDWHNESKVRLGMVRALRETSRTQDAERECADLLERAEQRADAHMAGLARHQRGLLLYAEGRAEEAYAQWESALKSLDGTDSSEVVGELKSLLAETSRAS